MRPKKASVVHGDRTQGLLDSMASGSCWQHPFGALRSAWFTDHGGHAAVPPGSFRNSRAPMHLIGDPWIPRLVPRSVKAAAQRRALVIGQLEVSG